MYIDVFRELVDKQPSSQTCQLLGEAYMAIQEVFAAHRCVLVLLQYRWISFSAGKGDRGLRDCVEAQPEGRSVVEQDRAGARQDAQLRKSNQLLRARAEAGWPLIPAVSVEATSLGIQSH